MTEDLGTRELGLLGAVGQGGGGFGEVDPVELDPTTVGAHEWARLGGELRDLLRVELDVAEHRGPAHLGQLVSADHRGVRSDRVEAERRLGPGPRQRRDPHVEPRGGRQRAGLGHELPGFVLGQDDLAATCLTGAFEHRHQAFESRQLVGQVPLRAALDERHLEGHQLAVLVRPRDRQEPGAVAVGRFEGHHQARVGGGRDPR